MYNVYCDVSNKNLGNVCYFCIRLFLNEFICFFELIFILENIVID